jgi:hypothetical protein
MNATGRCARCDRSANAANAAGLAGGSPQGPHHRYLICKVGIARQCDAKAARPGGCRR